MQNYRVQRGEKIGTRLEMTGTSAVHPRVSQNPSRHEHNWQAQRARFAIWSSDKYSDDRRRGGDDRLASKWDTRGAYAEDADWTQ